MGDDSSDDGGAADDHEHEHDDGSSVGGSTRPPSATSNKLLQTLAASTAAFASMFDGKDVREGVTEMREVREQRGAGAAPLMCSPHLVGAQSIQETRQSVAALTHQLTRLREKLQEHEVKFLSHREAGGARREADDGEGSGAGAGQVSAIS